MIAVFLDLSKAFDTLEHTALFQKLEKYGIRGNALCWFKSYLNNRTLSVKCRTKDSGSSSLSDKYMVEYGTPQGSCLGPLLFLIFCNDIHLVLEFCNCILFADDTTIYKTHCNPTYLEWIINEDLKLASDWFKANKLTLNLNKTVCMYFHLNKIKATNVTIKIDSRNIPQVETTKFLGITLDHGLTWKKHIDNLLRKIKSNLKILQESKCWITKHVLQILYYSQIYSHLSYGISVWGNSQSETTLMQLQKLQNKAVKIITDINEIKPNDFQELKILCVKQIISLENLKFAYKIKNHLLPSKINECSFHDHNGRTLKKKTPVLYQK